MSVNEKAHNISHTRDYLKMEAIKSVNKLKLLIESIYPNYDLLRINNILNKLLATLKLIENCIDCKKEIMQIKRIKTQSKFSKFWLKVCDGFIDNDNDLIVLLSKSINLLKKLSNRLEKK